MTKQSIERYLTRRVTIALLASLALLSSLAAGPAHAALTRVEITKREPFAGGMAFGNSGAYERIQGRFRAAATTIRRA